MKELLPFLGVCSNSKAGSYDKRHNRKKARMTNWKYKVLVRILDMSNNTWSWWDDKSDMRTIEQRLNEWTTGGWRLVKVITVESAGSTVELQFFLEIET